MHEKEGLQYEQICYNMRKNYQLPKHVDYLLTFHKQNELFMQVCFCCTFSPISMMHALGMI